MSKADTRDLIRFLKPFSREIRELALWLREFVWDLYPESNELIYDNYTALAFGWTPTDRTSEVFCSVAIGTNKHINFGFYWGAKIPDPRKLLLGSGKQFRFFRVRSKADFPKAYVKQLLRSAYAYSLSISKAKDCSLKGATITRSVQPVKRRPGKNGMLLIAKGGGHR